MHWRLIGSAAIHALFGASGVFNSVYLNPTILYTAKDANIGVCIIIETIILIKFAVHQIIWRHIRRWLCNVRNTFL